MIHPRAVTRRRALRGLAALTAPLCGCAPMPSYPVAGPGLRETAARQGRFYGAAVSARTLADPAFADALVAEAGMLVPESEAKWRTVHPAPDRYDFGPLDRIVAFAGTHRMAFRGHCLVWHQAMPDWLPPTLRAGDARGILERHIAAVAGRTRGRTQSWDVVNEAVDPRAPGGLRATPWLQALGPGFIDVAFHAARAADPAAKLVYNDYGTEYSDPAGIAKRAAVLDLLRGMTARGVPVDALGLQSHLRLGGPLPDASGLRAFIREAAALGLDVYLTELDVNDRDSTGDVAERDALIAHHADAYLAAALAEPAVKGVITWGLSDKYSWLNNDPTQRRRDGGRTRGLPLDAEMRRAPLWGAITGTMEREPVRPG